ncbi:MAG TPA: sigma-70 family RNA polymerase sigma factor [Polyangiaceae bacterium]|nr:sigma-70 family RNA polymerase sigma factor [Polyangiaceae bacterium]
MIRDGAPPHHEGMDASLPDLALPKVGNLARAEDRPEDGHGRITAIVRAEHDFVWRLLRRLGIPDASADDATQQVFVVAARRVNEIARGSERSYLFGVALRVASDHRRSREARQRRDTESVGESADTAPGPEELTERSERRRILDDVLAALPMELRAVIVLFELEQMTKTEVATLLGIPVGTAVSRLRRAREEFKVQAAKRLRARPEKKTP